MSFPRFDARDLSPREPAPRPEWPLCRSVLTVAHPDEPDRPVQVEILVTGDEGLRGWPEADQVGWLVHHLGNLTVAVRVLC